MIGLKNKRVLITAGPTWVPIDAVRIISNLASGKTGILLAEGLCKQGAGVTLFLGPINYNYVNRRIKIIRFSFFDELRKKITKELRSQNYDFVIHSAAVSDFAPQKSIKGKIKSVKNLTLRLVAQPKIAHEIRRQAPQAKLIIFKLETSVSDRQLLERAREALVKAKADWVVANRITPSYKAFILNPDKIYAQVHSRQALSKQLINIIYKTVNLTS